MERLTMLATVVAATFLARCGDRPQAPPIEWSKTRHGALPKTQVVGEVIVLCNCDDDDGDGRVDHADRHINGTRDADDLEEVTPRAVDGALDRMLSFDLVRRASDARSRVDAVRVFLGDRAVLGPEGGAEHRLEPTERRRLEEGRLRLFVEALAFGVPVRLELREHLTEGYDVLEEIEIRSAPWLVAPPGAGVERVTVCTDEKNRLVRDFHDAVRRHCLECGVPEEAIDSIPVAESRHGKDWWVQDPLQWGYTRAPWQEEPMPVALHLPRVGALCAWANGLLAPDVGYVRPGAAPETWRDSSELTFGGNLEVTPALGGSPLGRLCAGLSVTDRTLGPKARESMRTLGAFLSDQCDQPLVTTATDWLVTGHLDQLFAFLPPADDSGRVVLLVASPQDGTRLLDALADEPVPEPFASRYQRIVAPDSGETFRWKDVLASTRTRGQADTLRAYNVSLHRRIFGSSSEAGLLDAFLGGLGAAPDDLRVVPVPAFFYQGNVSDRVCAVPLVPNLVNLVVLGTHLLVPDPHLESFRAELVRRLEVYDVRWVETFRYLHVKQAGVHCATNVRYAPPAGGRWWEIVAR